jgi:hypothetical protein
MVTVSSQHRGKVSLPLSAADRALLLNAPQRRSLMRYYCHSVAILSDLGIPPFLRRTA